MSRRSTTHQEAIKRLAVLVPLALIVLASSTPALAIPAFARKYRTSCQTCHVAFPTLNPFGDAFRLNGYRFPEGSDASVSKDTPVSLGAEGYKKLWPHAVWPGEIPGTPPVAFVVESEIAYARPEKLTSFTGLGGELALLTGGTFGNHISFYGEVEFARANGASETSLERLNLQFRPLASPLFQFKVGAFEPGVSLVSNHRRLTDHQYFFLNAQVGDNQWSLEPFQQGIEFFGIVHHRGLYSAGLVEGAGNVENNSKDYYGRIEYKFGGLRLDGTTPEGGGSSPLANPKPWSELSLTFSAYDYQGIAQLSQTDTVLINDPLTNIVTPVETTISQQDDFDMWGADVRANLWDVIIYAGASKRTDSMPLLSNPSLTNVDSKNLWGEVEWVAYPWLIPATRWESFEVSDEKTEQISLTLNFLIRANIKAFVAGNELKEPGGSFGVEEFVGGVAFGM